MMENLLMKRERVKPMYFWEGNKPETEIKDLNDLEAHDYE